MPAEQFGNYKQELIKKLESENQEFREKVKVFVKQLANIVDDGIMTHQRALAKLDRFIIDLQKEARIAKPDSEEREIFVAGNITGKPRGMTKKSVEKFSFAGKGTGQKPNFPKHKWHL